MARADPRRRRRPRRARDAALRLPDPGAGRASSSRTSRRTSDVRRYAEEQIERLDRLGHASSKADEGPRESRGRGSAGTRSRRPRRADDPLPRRSVNVFVTGGSRGIGRAIALALRARRREARRDRVPPQRRGGRGRRRRSCARSAPSRRSCAATSPRSACSTRSRRSGRSTCSCTTRRRGVIRPALETEDKHWDWTMNANARALLAARARRRAGDAGRLVDRRASRRSARSACSRTTSLVGTSKAALEALVRYLGVELAPRDPRQRRLGRRRRDRRAGALPEPRGDAAGGRREPGRSPRHARTTSPARSRSSARRTPR